MCFTSGIMLTDCQVPLPKSDGSIFKHAPVCVTQKSIPLAFQGGPASIVIGISAECPRWVPGSVIRWAAWRAGFDSQDDADYAAIQLQTAAEIWNAANVGVTFEWVSLAQDATFVLCHGGYKGDILAEAFFPNKDDLSILNVHTAAFHQSWKHNMYKVFLHELGHVLGLRHEFALEDPREMVWKAVQLGPSNELSVMNYRKEPPELQQSDIDSTKLFYSLKNDANGKAPKVGMTVVKDYTPS